MGDIKICPDCKGEGTVFENLSQNNYNLTECERCKGSGKVYRRNYALELPFVDRDNNRFKNLDKIIIDSIRELKKSLT